MFNEIIDKLANKNIAILGFGKEGRSTYNFIRRHSSQFLTILDKNDVLSNNPYLTITGEIILFLKILKKGKVNFEIVFRK